MNLSEKSISLVICLGLSGFDTDFLFTIIIIESYLKVNVRAFKKISSKNELKFHMICLRMFSWIMQRDREISKTFD